MQTRINNCAELEPYVTQCDKYIADFLHQDKPTMVTLYRKLIEFYFKKPFFSATSDLSTNDIGKIASSATMNLAETGTLDENLDTTKTLISQALTPAKTDDMESVVSLQADEDASQNGDTQQLPFEEDHNNMDATDTINRTNLKIENLAASIHAPKNVTPTQQNKNIRIEPHDLRHKLTNRNTSTLYARISAKKIPGRERLNKLNYVLNYFSCMRGYTNVDWVYDKPHRYITIEFTRDSFLADAVADFNQSMAPLSFETVTKDSSNSTQSPDTTNTFILKSVPFYIQHTQVNTQLSYFGDVIAIHDIYENTYTRSRDIKVDFKTLKVVRDEDLFKKWSVNINGECIRIHHFSVTAEQLKLRNQYVAGFKGFDGNTSPAQIMRLFKKYNGMTCYYFSGIAFFE